MVNGTLTVEGSLTANGDDGQAYSGGGSGGSIYMTTATLTGTGVISTDGGSGGHNGGGGGGGRIAVYYETNVFTGRMSAHGGAGYQPGEDGTIITPIDAPVSFGDLIEASFSQSYLVDALLVQKAVLSNAVVKGDLNGTFDFANLEMVSIESGSFAGNGFSKGQWQANLEGVSYTGDCKGFAYLVPVERRVCLKGVISGDISAIAKGYLTESVPDSGIYDQYEATWKLARVGSETISGTISLAGTVSYQESMEYLSTQLYALQTSVEGTTFGHYTGPLSTVLTHIRVADGNNPYLGEGFSIISYISDSGSGQGWAYNSLVSANISELKGMFSSPLLGIFSGALDESRTPRGFSIEIERIDLGLPPAPDLKVKTWGPTRVSPGQTINYIIEYRNDGLKTAEGPELIMKLPVTTNYISNTGGGRYNKESHEVVWSFENIPAKYRGYVSIKETILWGLPGGTLLDHTVIVPISKTEIEIDPTVSISDYEILEETENLLRMDATISSHSQSGAYHLEMSITEVPDEIHPFLDVTKTLEGWEFTWKFTVEGHSNDLVEIGFEASDVAVEISQKWSEVEDARRAQTEHGSFLDWLEDEGLISEDTYQAHKGWNKFRPKIPVIQWLIGKIPKFGWIAKFFPKGTPFGSIYANAMLWNEIKINLIFKQANGEIPWDVDSLDRLYMFYKSRESHDVSSTRSTVTTARDPSVKYGPAGRVSPGQRLDYKVEYENEGEGIAFGVYFTDTLDDDLDDSTLEIRPVIDVNDGSIISGPGNYNPATRTITWFAGEVGPGEGGYSVFDVNVRSDANEGTEIINYATIYFPSVPEETRTNGIVSIVSLNQTPVADCGGPYIGQAASWDGAVVELDGTGSSDHDGDALTYEWDLDLSVDSNEDGDPTNDVDATGANPSECLAIGQTEISLAVIDEHGARSEPDITTVTVSVVDVVIDIKPGSFPNAINMGSRGVIPVAFLTTLEFDASGIDPATVTLRGQDLSDGLVKLRGKKDAPVPMSGLEDVDGDGDLDLVVHLDTEKLAEYELEAVCEIGALTYDGYVVSGSDTIQIVPQ
jgi:uncharacterized repeat protein (TIGR01451 family)